MSGSPIRSFHAKQAKISLRGTLDFDEMVSTAKLADFEEMLDAVDIAAVKNAISNGALDQLIYMTPPDNLVAPSTPYAVELAHYMASLTPAARTRLVGHETGDAYNPLYRPIEQFEVEDFCGPYDISLTFEVLGAARIQLMVRNETREEKTFVIPTADFITHAHLNQQGLCVTDNIMERFVEAEQAYSMTPSEANGYKCLTASREGGAIVQKRLGERGLKLDMDTASKLFATATLISAQIHEASQQRLYRPPPSGRIC